MEISTSKSKKQKPVDIDKPKLTVKEFKRQWILVVISAIYIIYGIIFYYLPLVGWIIAFQDFKYNKGISGSKWVGFKKFQFLFHDKTFLMVIRNTFCMGALNLIFSTVVAIAFAILLNEVKNKYFKKSIQTISYLPHFLSWIIVVAIVHDALTSTGIINDILLRLHIVDTAFPFLARPEWFWPIVTLSNLWKETGWNAIIYLAAITSIDPCLYESASIDGAGRFQKMLYVTLPGLRPTIMILLLMNIGNVLNAGFELQYLLGNGLVQNVSRTIDIYVLDWALDARNLDYSLGTAAGIFKTVVSMTFIVVSNYIAKKKGDERLF
ncbi:ABC transporter permease [Butyrivibrio sp. AE2032]|uniref:ABC transporter permease n=1 Tax=Butyrivibrio sp. AE2032 TaxID=1458463 RepID=UPI000553FEF8|nr:ABC transporter permease subunit [Butyrivibrio sp. AE2032]